jgi:solute:Na+ symporter, SSS family
MVRDEREGRRAAAIPAFAFLLFPIAWGIPPLAATFVYQHMPAYTAGLSHPQDAAYLVMAKRVLPDGVLGLLVAGLFSASLSSLNTGLNRSAGIVVRSFYLSVIRPGATEAQEVFVGRWVTVAFGAVIIGLAEALIQARSLPLFELGILFSTCFALPIAIPLILVFFCRRAPGWASWSSALLGFTFSISMKMLFTHEKIDAFWHNAPLSAREWEDLYIVVQTGGTIVVTSGWFMLSQLWGDRESAAQRAGREEFYERLATPIDTAPEVLREAALKQYTYLGWLCLVWTVAISAMALMPNSPGGHYSFMFMALLFGVVGSVLLRLRASVQKAKTAP